ncbi:MAG TPA: hypothetical protein VGK07_00465 [Candidatus Limnocylindria bacterium]
MGVRVDEAGQEEPAGEIDDLGVRSAQREGVRGGSDVDDPVAADGDGLRLGQRRIDGPYPSAVDDEVGGFGRGAS